MFWNEVYVGWQSGKDYSVLCTSDVNKNWRLKAKDRTKDLTFKDMTKDFQTLWSKTYLKKLYSILDMLQNWQKVQSNVIEHGIINSAFSHINNFCCLFFQFVTKYYQAQAAAGIVVKEHQYHEQGVISTRRPGPRTAVLFLRTPRTRAKFTRHG